MGGKGTKKLEDDKKGDGKGNKEGKNRKRVIGKQIGIC